MLDGYVMKYKRSNVTIGWKVVVVIALLAPDAIISLPILSQLLVS